MKSYLIVAFALCAGCSYQSLNDSDVKMPSPDSRCNEVLICDQHEPGERLTLTGRVLDYNGRPLEKAAVIAYQADREGMYNPAGSPTRVPRLRGVAVTNKNGEFKFITVRPGPYPNAAEPAHIHFEVNAPAHELKYVTYWFEGDPLITEERRKMLKTDPETIIVDLVPDSIAGWKIALEIRLIDN